MATLRLKFVPVVVCLAFGLAACGDDSSSTTTDPATTPTDDTVDDGYARGSDAPDTTEATETSATDATDTSVDDSNDDVVMLADSSLGQIVVDAAGMTLYLFANDPPDVVTCTGGCASTWPPLLVDGDDADVGDGLDDDLFTIVGGQLSFNGHPLYYYAGDSAPGDTNGQGVGGVWFVLDAEGNAIA